MEDVNRRTALVAGLAAAAAPLFVSRASAAAIKEYGPDEGKELMPGIRMVELGTGNSDIPTYKSIKMVDIVFQPGAVFPETPMDNDMVCYIATGEFQIKKADKEFTLKEGEMYTCAKGKTDAATNVSSVVGVMRIAMLMPA